jgi:hypothetical protein
VPAGRRGLVCEETGALREHWAGPDNGRKFLWQSFRGELLPSAASAEEFRPRADQALAGMEFESRLPIGEVMVTNSLLKIFAY